MVVASERSESAESAIAIRRGSLSDLNSVIVIERAAFGRHALDPTTLFWLLLRRWPGFLIAEISGKLVGYVITRVAIWPWRRRTGGVTSIAVHPDYRRQGVGRKLMQAAAEFLSRSGAITVDLEVSLRNSTAISLYKSLGFVSRQLLPDYYGSGEDGMRMTLIL